MPADLLAFALATALAAEPDAPPETPPVALLEFLGLWTTEEGRWIDPEVLDALPEPDPKADGASTAPPEPRQEDPTAKGGAEDAHDDAHE